MTPWRSKGGGQRLRILATGFEPFPGMPVNVSGALALALAQSPPRLIPRCDLHAAVLPTDWQRAWPEAQRLLLALRPDIIVHFGVSGRARGFAIETRAFNAADTREDGSCQMPVRASICRTAPGCLPATLPALPLLRRLRGHGLTAELSRDPGRYLCNFVLFRTLHWLRLRRHDTLAGFIHIPPAGSPGAALMAGAALIVRESAAIAHGARTATRSVA